MKGNILWDLKMDFYRAFLIINNPSELDEDAPTELQQITWEYITMFLGGRELAIRVGRWREYTDKEKFINEEVTADASLMRMMDVDHLHRLLQILRDDVRERRLTEYEDLKFQRDMRYLYQVLKLLGCVCHDWFPERCACTPLMRSFEFLSQKCYTCKIHHTTYKTQSFWMDHIKLQRALALKQVKGLCYRQRDWDIILYFSDFIDVDWRNAYLGFTELLTKINNLFRTEGYKHCFSWYEIHDEGTDIVIRDNNYVTQFMSVHSGNKYKMSMMVCELENDNVIHENIDFTINEVM